jgi:hypothetical protein
MAISTYSIGRIGNQNRATGTMTCTGAGETIAVTDTNSRIVTFQAINSDGQESPQIELNVDGFGGSTVNGSVEMAHGGADADVWYYECTYV